jgi:hypothetical protein
MIDNNHFDHESALDESSRYDGFPDPPSWLDLFIAIAILSFIIYLATSA